MEWLRATLETVGQAVDADPAVRGGVVLGTTAAGLVGLLLARRGRGRAGGRVKVRVDAPPEADVEVRTRARDVV